MARKIRKTQFILDGEAVVLGVDGVSDFNALHSHKHDYEVLRRRWPRILRNSASCSFEANCLAIII
jgi:ATP-dependent DNA ligase